MIRFTKKKFHYFYRTKKTPICNDCNVGPNEGTTQKGPVCKDCEVGPPSEDGNTGDVVVKKPEHGPNCVCVNDVCYNCDVGK